MIDNATFGAGVSLLLGAGMSLNEAVKATKDLLAAGEHSHEWERFTSTPVCGCPQCAHPPERSVECDCGEVVRERDEPTAFPELWEKAVEW